MKINEDLDITIKDYIANIDDGVLSLLSIIYLDTLYEGSYWYDLRRQVVTIPIELESEIGSIIEAYIDYDFILKSLRESEADYKVIIESLDSDYI